MEMKQMTNLELTNVLKMEFLRLLPRSIRTSLKLPDTIGISLLVLQAMFTHWMGLDHSTNKSLQGMDQTTFLLLMVNLGTKRPNLYKKFLSHCLDLKQK